MSLAERLAKQEAPDRSGEVRDRVQEKLVEILGVRLYDDAILWQALSERSQEHIRRYFSRDAARTAIRELLDSLPTRG